jgi:hypothetical protein
VQSVFTLALCDGHSSEGVSEHTRDGTRERNGPGESAELNAPTGTFKSGGLNAPTETTKTPKSSPRATTDIMPIS